MESYLLPRLKRYRSISKANQPVSRSIDGPHYTNLQNVRSDIRKLLAGCRDSAVESEERFNKKFQKDALEKAVGRIYTKDSIKRKFPLIDSVNTLEELLTTLELRQLRGVDKNARTVVKHFYTLCTDTVRNIKICWDRLVDICKILNRYFRVYEKFDEKANTGHLLVRLQNLRTSLPVKCKSIAEFIKLQEHDPEDPATGFTSLSQKHTVVTQQEGSSTSDLFEPILQFFRDIFLKINEAFDVVDKWLEEDEHYVELLVKDRKEVRFERKTLHRSIVMEQRELGKLRVSEDVRGARKTLEALSIEIKSLENEKNSITEEIFQMENDLESIRITRMRLSYDFESTGKLASTGESIEDIETVTSLSKQINDLARKATELESTVTSLGFRLERVKKQLALKRQQRDALEYKYRRLTGLEERRVELQKRIKAFQSALHRLDIKVEKLDNILQRKMHLLQPIINEGFILQSDFQANVTPSLSITGSEFKSPTPLILTPSPAIGARDSVLPAIGHSVVSNKHISSQGLESVFQYLKETLPIGREWPNIFRRLPWPKEITSDLVESEIVDIRKNTRGLKEQAYRSFKVWENVAGSLATKNNLVDVLVECKLNRIAETVVKKR